ncbi:MAG: hypothetical protein J5654_08635 [Victivallales bacterium]|nr:hypothetical protein [Victivallales bacterium]
MASPRTTVALLALLALSLALFRPVALSDNRSIPSVDAPVPVAGDHPAPSEASTPAARPHRPKPQRLARSVYQLRTTKTQEERRLYDIKLYGMIRQCGIGYGIQSATSRFGTQDQANDQERVEQLRQQYFESARHFFHVLEDYILDTEFTALTDDETDLLYQYLELRRQIEEARENYYDIPPEEWCELAKEESRLRVQCLPLVKRQFDADSAEAQALRQALMRFLPEWCIICEQCGDDYAEIFLPQP